MDIVLAALADYAAVTDHGKLVIAGVFDAIRVPQIPARHPMMALAMRIHAEPGEGATHDVTVRLVDPDGAEVLPELKASVQFKEHGPGEGGDVQIVMHAPGVVFKKLGPHAFDVFIDGSHLTSLSLWVRLTADGPPPGASPS